PRRPQPHLPQRLHPGLPSRPPLVRLDHRHLLHPHQWFDTYPGFHNIISNNIVAGEFDSSSNHTDGNGIILDLSNGSYNASTANTPPVLIINNVVYGNGGRCIHAYIVTNFWISGSQNGSQERSMHL